MTADPAKWPFLQILDGSGRDMGWCGLAGPLRDDGYRRTYAELAARYRLIGFTSHGEFPDGRGHDYPVAAWCHCFRDPTRRLPRSVPYALLSESDFVDAGAIQSAISTSSGGVQADYVVVCLPGWPEPVKRTELAKACTWQLGRLGLRGLVVGPSSAHGFAPGTTCRKFLPWGDLMASITRARFSLFSNGLDASPRLLTETLCCDRPIVAPADLLGGWKYVTPETGEFFTSPHDVADAVLRCLGRPRRPSDWFHRHCGPALAGAQLYGLLRSIDPSLPPGGVARIVRR